LPDVGGISAVIGYSRVPGGPSVALRSASAPPLSSSCTGISRAAAVDQVGPLPLVRRVVASPGGGRVLELAASRTAVGTVTLRYHVRSIAAAAAKVSRATSRPR
jgi:hypothetical protein